MKIEGPSLILWWTQPGEPFNPKARPYMSALGTGLDMSTEGWVRIGTAEITYTLDEKVDIVAQQVAAINALMEKERQKFEAEMNTLRQMKANLLALTYTPPEGDAQ